MSKKEIKTHEFYNYLKKIVSLFQCENCGLCCRENQIFLFPEDFERIKEKNPEIYNMLDKSVVSRYYIHSPCGFLNAENRCKIYNDRPVVCEIYPFSLSVGYAGIAIYPCPIGIQIMKKIDEYKMYSEKGKKPIKYVDEKSELGKEINEIIGKETKFKEAIEGKQKDNDKIQIRVIDPRTIKPLYKYLKSHSK